VGQPAGQRDRADPPPRHGRAARPGRRDGPGRHGHTAGVLDDWLDTPTYNRPDLAPGDVVSGPAIIEEFGSTVPVHPGFAATVDSYGNLLLTKEVSP